ncbi:MAG: ATP-binding protein [Verrucomicrobiae bacterium]|nr:ATP-binding protein [Verrucomicrobiae bacterium]
MIYRLLEKQICEWLKDFPAVGLVGPRQCGKSTLAHAVLSKVPHSLYLDLENPADRAKLNEPLIFFDTQRDKLICLDEIQRVPDLFPVLRTWLDRQNKAGQMLLLGSASPELLRQSSESLAGRIGFLELTPFLQDELTRSDQTEIPEKRLLIRGGYPRSYLARNNEASWNWRQEFVRSHIERDLPSMGIGVGAEQIRRFWTMCAHTHGQLWNGAILAQSLGISQPTVRTYRDVLTRTFMLRVLPSWETNLKKRLIRSPKVYVRDVGLLWALLGIENVEESLGHPLHGFAYEGWVLEQILSRLPSGWNHGFYRTSGGAEIDLVLQKGKRIIGIEIKASLTPSLSRGFWQAREDLALTESYCIAPVPTPFPLKDDIWTGSVRWLTDQIFNS